MALPLTGGGGARGWDFGMGQRGRVLSDDPNELRGEEAVAFGVLDRALADLIAVVEHNGRSLKISRGDREIPNTPEARAELRDEVIDWFFNPDDGEFSLNLVCGHLGCSPEAWAWSVHQYLDNPKRHGIPLHWRRLDRGKVTEIELALKADVPKKTIARMFRVDRTLITKIANGRRWQKQRAA